MIPLHHAVRACVVAAMAATSAAHAQSAQAFSLQGSLLIAGQQLNGNLVAGAGFEGQARYTRALWSYGLGIQTSAHKSGSEEIDIFGVFFEPRRVIYFGNDRIAPYVAGRLALLHESSTFNDAGKVSSNGYAFGAGCGMLIKLNVRMNIDIGAAFVEQSFQSVDGANGTRVSFSSFTGYVAKAGLSFGFGAQ